MGFVDLCFPGVAQKYFEVYDLIKNSLEKDMSLKRAGKSLSIRIIVPKISCSESFFEQVDEITECLDAVERLQEMTKKIDCEAILNMKE